MVKRSKVLSALRRKLLRELWQMRMQMLSIALVVATGVMTVMTMRGSYDSLDGAMRAYYAETRFADIWAPLVRAPMAVLRRLETIPGVASVDGRVTLFATLDLPGVDMPAQGRFVSLPASGRPRLNGLRIVAGRYPDPGALTEALINEKFAQARGLRPGDRVSVVINGRAERLTVAGIANSPEFSYAVPPGSLLPEYERFGVFWISEEFLGPAYDMDGAFNEVVLTLQPGVPEAAVIGAVDSLLEPYGGLGAYPRADQPSHLILASELAQIRVQGTVIPAIFLGVAVFLLHQVLGRLIAVQRGEIAIMKAFGYTDAETGAHYLMFALLPALAGSLMGGIGGAWLGDGLIGLYGDFLELPELEYRLTPMLLALAAGLSVAGALAGALGAMRKAAGLPPAEAMRPDAPARFHSGPLERIGVGLLLPAAGRMILRNLERRPFQAALGVTGVALAMAILVIGMFMFDSMRYLMDVQFRRIQREDVALVFREEVSEAVRHELGRLPGVLLVETWRSAPARLRAGHLEEEVAITALAGGGLMRRLVDTRGEAQALPAGGIVLSAMLARKLRTAPGDMLALEWLDGKRLRGSVQVSGTTDDFVGLSAYMSKNTMNVLSGTDDLVSGAWLRTGGAEDRRLFSELKQMPGISGVSSPAELLQVFEDQMAKNLKITSAFLLGFAGILAFGVVYNSARIALSERGRELASLRVMGFHRGEVATLLLGEQATITLLALPLGSALGYWLAWLIAKSLESDTYRIPFVTSPATYVIAGCIILAAAAVSTVAVRWRLDRIELVSVLKTRE